MRRNAIHIVLSHLLLLLFVFDVTQPLHSYAGSDTVQHHWLYDDAEKETREKEAKTDVHSTEYIASQHRMRISKSCLQLSVGKHRYRSRLSLQNYYPSVPTPPPNA